MAEADQVGAHLYTLQNLIAAYLAYRNALPFTAVLRGGNENQKNEAAKTARLRAVDQGAPLEESDLEELRADMWGLLARDALGAIAAASDANNAPGIRKRASEQVGDTQGASYEARLIDIVAQHLVTLREAYPLAYTRAGIGTVEAITAYLGKFSRAWSPGLGPADLAPLIITRMGTRPSPLSTEGNLPAPRLPGDLSVPQRFGVQIVIGDTGHVGDLQVAFRPPGIFGAKHGGHTTAWVAFVDVMRNTVVGYRVIDALRQVADEYAEARQLPGADERVTAMLPRQRPSARRGATSAPTTEALTERIPATEDEVPRGTSASTGVLSDEDARRAESGEHAREEGATTENTAEVMEVETGEQEMTEAEADEDEAAEMEAAQGPLSAYENFMAAATLIENTAERVQEVLDTVPSEQDTTMASSTGEGETEEASAMDTPLSPQQKAAQLAHVGLLQEFVAAYLQYRNSLGLTAVLRTDQKGRGETGGGEAPRAARLRLAQLGGEVKAYKPTVDLAFKPVNRPRGRAAREGMDDDDNPARAVTVTAYSAAHQRNDMWMLLDVSTIVYMVSADDAARVPGVNAGRENEKPELQEARRAQIAGFVIAQHLMTMERAYPDVYAAIDMGGAESVTQFLAYLVRRLGDAVHNGDTFTAKTHAVVKKYLDGEEEGPPEELSSMDAASNLASSGDKRRRDDGGDSDANTKKRQVVHAT